MQRRPAPHETLPHLLQLNSGLINARDGGPRPAIDEDTLDCNQGFDHIPRGVLQPIPNSPCRPPFNLPRFHTPHFHRRWSQCRAALRWLPPHTPRRPLDHRRTWFPSHRGQDGHLRQRTQPRRGALGVYLTRTLPSLHTNVDLDYLGYDHKAVRYTQGTGREQRETMGARVW